MKFNIAQIQDMWDETPNDERNVLLRIFSKLDNALTLCGAENFDFTTSCEYETCSVRVEIPIVQYRFVGEIYVYMDMSDISFLISTNDSELNDRCLKKRWTFMSKFSYCDFIHCVNYMFERGAEYKNALHPDSRFYEKAIRIIQKNTEDDLKKMLLKKQTAKSF